MALITAARAKQSINQSTFTSAENDIIDSLVEAVDDYTRSYTNRQIEQTSHDEIHIGTGSPYMLLADWPVVSVSYIGHNEKTALRVKNTGTGVQRAFAVSSNTGIILSRWAGATLTTETEIAFACNPTITDVKDAVIAKGNGWTAEVVNDLGSHDSDTLAAAQGLFNFNNTIRPRGSLGAYNQWAHFKIWSEDIANFDIEPGSGMLIKDPEVNDEQSLLRDNNFNSGWILGKRYRVNYSAGYATIPEDIQEALSQWVAAWFWQVKDNPAVYPDFPSASIVATLDRYKRTGI